MRGSESSLVERALFLAVEVGATSLSFDVVPRAGLGIIFLVGRIGSEEHSADSCIMIIQV